MSGRGGRGGRGGYKPPTGAQLFLQRSAQESGLDERNLRSLQDLTRPVLFPDYFWHSSGDIWKGTDEEVANEIVVTKRTQSQIYLIRKSREIQHRMHTSPYYLQAAQETDVARYRRKRSTNASQACDRIVREHLGGVVATAAYTPEELLDPKRAELSSSNAKQQTILYDEDGFEIKGESGEEEEEENQEDLSVAPEEDEEEVEDYTTNHYASEDEESDGGGDGEPTF